MDKPLEMNESAGPLSSERVALITKIYGLLTVCLLLAGVGAWVGGTFLSVTALLPLSLVSLLLMVTMLVFRRVSGVNLALLLGFSVLDGMWLGPILNIYVAKGLGPVVNQALFMTFGTFAALTAYVFWSRSDFSYLRGFLYTGIWALFLVALVAMFTGMSSGFYLVYCYFAVLLFVGYTLYDTANVIHHVQPDEYVQATLMLFLDVVNLFWYILQIFINRED